MIGAVTTIYKTSRIFDIVTLQSEPPSNNIPRCVNSTRFQFSSESFIIPAAEPKL